MAENQRAASAIGLSPDWIAAASWALGSALVGVAVILSPIVQLQVVLTVTVLLTFWVIMSAPIRALPRAGDAPRGAGRSTGGEQQMLTLARAPSRHPHVSMADELSMGLAPSVVKRLLEAVVRGAKQHRMAVLLVEQHIRKAPEHGDRARVIKRGRIELTGRAPELLARIADIENHYVAVVAGG